ncbi:MAG: IS3 family transposase, partial [Lachnospiraceae bacterium]|nr:IS3 family transposase [Lachnospiraceae bacterium]
KYSYDEAGNLAAITYPDGSMVRYVYDLNDNLVKVEDREGNITTYVYDAINRITEIHRPNGISTYNTYDAGDRITELTNICDDCGWVVSRYAYEYDDRGFIVGETATESLAGYAWDEKHDGKHEDGRHDALYSHGNKHAKHGKDSTYAYQIVETARTFTYDGAGKLLSATETEENQGTYTCSYGYDAMGNRTSVVKTDVKGKVVESRYYVYNESSQLISVELYDGKKTTTVTYAYDADGNLVSETGRDGTEKVEKTYLYAVENRLLAVYDGKELLMAAAYDGDGNRVFQLNYNLHTDGDLKGNSGNGNGKVNSQRAVANTQLTLPTNSRG